MLTPFATATTAQPNAGGMWVYWLMIIGVFVLMYFVTIRPQRKQEKELKNLRDNLQIGDEIMTIGGFYGTVVRIKEDRITIASGAEKTKMEITKSAISQVLNRDIPQPNSKKEDAPEETKASPKTIKKLSKKEDTQEQSAEEAKTEEKAE